MTFRTRITELLGIEHPIVMGGMQVVGVPELAAAVSEAGGLGMLTALTFPSPAALGEAIARCRALTAKPFGVNISVFPAMNAPDYPAIVATIADAGVTIVETAGTPAVRAVWDLLHARGITILHKCTSVRHALSSERYGVHAMSIDGFECAGHPGEDDIPGLVLIPAAADQVKVPLIASGGIADARGLVAALALGAEGVNMGTRFCATQEARIHPNVKQAYLDNDERGTVLLFRKLNNTARVGRSRVSEDVVRILDRSGTGFADVADLVSGANGRALLASGDLDRGVYWASMAQGLIHDLPTCENLIERIITEAKQLVERRLGRMMLEGQSV